MKLKLLNKFISVVFANAFFCFFLLAFLPNDLFSQQKYTVVLDAGHGGTDPGARGKISWEKDIALSISLELGRILKENIPALNIVYTRKEDKFLTLYRRSEIANKSNADLFISIHADSFSKSSVYGATTYLMGLSKSSANMNVAKRENSVIFLEEDYEQTYKDFDPNSSESVMLLSLTQKAKIDNSTILANLIQDQFKNRVGIRSRGVKQAPFQVLWNTTMPSVLIETGFMTNPAEEKKLNNKMHRVYIASAIFRAIRDYKTYLESNV